MDSLQKYYTPYGILQVFFCAFTRKKWIVSSAINAYSDHMEILQKLESYLSYPILKKVFIGVVSIAWSGTFLGAYKDGNFYWGRAVHETGELGWALLLFVIFVSLAQKIVRLHVPKFPWIARFLPLRKEAGIFAFLIIGSHALAEFLKRGVLGDTSAMIDAAFTTHHAAVFGSISFLIMLPLFLTSTNWAIKKMGPKAWKNLQRFAHVAFVFAALHVALIDFFGYGKIDGGATLSMLAYFGGYAYLWHKKKQLKTNTL